MTKTNFRKSDVWDHQNLYSKHPLWFQKGAHPYVNPLQPQILSDPLRSFQIRQDPLRSSQILSDPLEEEDEEEEERRRRRRRSAVWGLRSVV